MGLQYIGAGGSGGNGLVIVADDAGRTGLAPTEGTAVYQEDTKEFWIWTGGSFPTGQWSLFGRVDNIIFAKDTASIDLTVDAQAGTGRPAEPVTLTAVLKLSASAADAGSQLVELDIQADGLRAQILDSQIRGLFSATAPLTYNNTTGLFAMPVSTDSADGYLSATDHTALTTVIAGLAAHLADTVDAHDASAISFVPVGTIAATDVQAAIAEVATDAAAALAASDFADDARLDALEAVSHVAVTLAAFSSTPSFKGLTITTQDLNMDPADATHPGGVSIAAQNFAGEKRFLGGAKVGASSALASSEIFNVTSIIQGSTPAPVMTTAQRTAITSPVAGLRAYDSDLKQPFYFNGANWEPERGLATPSAATVADAGTLSLGSYRRQVLRVGGSGGPATVATLDTTNALAGDELILLGNDDTNPVTLSGTTNANTKGSVTLALGDSVQLIFIGAAWYETNRNA